VDCVDDGGVEAFDDFEDFGAESQIS